MNQLPLWDVDSLSFKIMYGLNISTDILYKARQTFLLEFMKTRYVQE